MFVRVALAALIGVLSVLGPQTAAYAGATGCSSRSFHLNVFTNGKLEDATRDAPAGAIVVQTWVYSAELNVQWCYWNGQLPRQPDGTLQIRAQSFRFLYLAPHLVQYGPALVDQEYWISSQNWHERVRAYVVLCTASCRVLAVPYFVVHLRGDGTADWSGGDLIF